MKRQVEEAAAKLEAALEALDREAGTNPRVRAVHEALDRLHVETCAAGGPTWKSNSLGLLGAAHLARIRQALPTEA